MEGRCEKRVGGCIALTKSYLCVIVDVHGGFPAAAVPLDSNTRHPFTRHHRAHPAPALFCGALRVCRAWWAPSEGCRVALRALPAPRRRWEAGGVSAAPGRSPWMCSAQSCWERRRLCAGAGCPGSAGPRGMCGSGQVSQRLSGGAEALWCWRQRQLGPVRGRAEHPACLFQCACRCEQSPSLALNSTPHPQFRPRVRGLLGAPPHTSSPVPRAV